MKTVFTITFILLMKCAVSQTVALDTAQVPKDVRNAFTKDHPAISPDWKADGKNYKAFYTDPKTKVGRMVVYDVKGSVLREENAMDQPKKKGEPAPADKGPEAK